ncbi:Lsr2 family protein, partial [Streptomyces sp. SID11233]|nr:Lsr2 family protein [Streptomyces sp. SID11233]
AQKVQVLLVDDLDGGEADETVTFALDGKSYEIDLTTANADKLRGLLEDYIKSGRRTGGRGSAARGKARSSSTGSSEETAA